MNEKLLAIKAAIALFFTALGEFLGWKGIIVGAWVGAMLLDYLSGTAAALKAGEWSSKVAREGIWHKCGEITAVLVAALVDAVLLLFSAHIPEFGFLWPGVILPLVVAWYIITELGSILENAIRLGATVPDWLVKLLKISLKAVDAAGEKSAGREEDT